MNRAETATLLALAAAFDRRTVGEADVAAWAAALRALPFAEARDAIVQHYATSTAWLMPGHITALVTERRVALGGPNWCGKCDERTRLRLDPESLKPTGRCPICHPLMPKASAS